MLGLMDWLKLDAHLGMTLGRIRKRLRLDGFQRLKRCHGIFWWTGRNLRAKDLIRMINWQGLPVIIKICDAVWAFNVLQLEIEVKCHFAFFLKCSLIWGIIWKVVARHFISVSRSYSIMKRSLAPRVLTTPSGYGSRYEERIRWWFSCEYEVALTFLLNCALLGNSNWLPKCLRIQKFILIHCNKDIRESAPKSCLFT